VEVNFCQGQGVAVFDHELEEISTFFIKSLFGESSGVVRLLSMPEFVDVVNKKLIVKFTLCIFHEVLKIKLAHFERIVENNRNWILLFLNIFHEFSPEFVRLLISKHQILNRVV